MSQDTLRRKQTCILVQDCTKKLICRAQTLHQEIAFSILDHLNGLSNCFQFDRVVNDGKLSHIDILLTANLLYDCPITDKNHINQAQIYRLRCSRNGMVINAPGRDHLFLDIAALQV